MYVPLYSPSPVIHLIDIQLQETEHDMIASLMNQHYRSGKVLQDHEIAHIMIALLMAGQHTSSATGSWILLHLADRPDVWYVPFLTSPHVLHKL